MSTNEQQKFYRWTCPSCRLTMSSFVSAGVQRPRKCRRCRATMTQIPGPRAARQPSSVVAMPLRVGKAAAAGDFDDAA